MFRYFNEKRVKISKDRKTKLIQTNPVVDFLTTKEYLQKNQTYFRLYVIHPFEIIDRKTKEKKTLEIGNFLDVYKHEIDVYNPEEWILVTFRDKIFQHPLGESYLYGDRDKDLAEDNYLANLHSIYDCTIPYDTEFYFWLSWKDWELEYANNEHYVGYIELEENLCIAGNILGFLRFSDKIAYKTFRGSLADAIQKYIIITNNHPSCYEKSQAKSSLKQIIRDLNHSACEMNIVEPVYKSFDSYLADKQKEALIENARLNEEKKLAQTINNKRRSINEKLLEDLSYKEDFFSEIRNY